MEEQLRSFLEECKVHKGEPFTHTTKSTGSVAGNWPAGSYYVDNKYLDAFWTRYCNAISRSSKPTITEKPGPLTPLRVDFDFKSTLENGPKRQYSTGILKKIVEFYQIHIREIIDPSDFDEKMLWCLVLEKPAPREEGGLIKDGFHLHFPYFICEAWVQDVYLRNKVSESMVDDGIWTGGKFVTKVEDFIDTNMAKKPWMVYGSMNHKSEHSTPYLYNRWKKVSKKKRFGHAFDHELSEMSLQRMFEGEMSGRKKAVKYYLPRFLTVRGYSRGAFLKSIVDKKKDRHQRKHKARRRQRIPRTRPIEKVMEDIKMIEDGEIMEMISDARADSYQEWMNMGWTLFNIGQGCDEALDMWINFSRRSTKFVDGECELIWGSMEARNKTIASLFEMAKKDSPKKYDEWKTTNIRYWLWQSLFYIKNPAEHDVAMVVHTMFKGIFKCVDAKRNIWYQFRDHRWRVLDDAISLRKKLVRDVKSIYSELKAELTKEITDCDFTFAEVDEEDKKDAKRMMKEKIENKGRCSRIIDELKRNAFQTKVIQQCKMEMHDNEFLKKMDENKKLMGCENGVLDCELEIFRDGLPDDYITFSTGIDFLKHGPDEYEVEELDDYLEKVYPNRNRRNYFLDFFASCIQGGNVNKRFLIATGPTDGAKSMTFALLAMAFGEGNEGYFGKFNREMLVQSTSSNSSSTCRPELARVRGKRIMSCQEIGKNESLNIGFLKEITGNDSIYARTLHEKGSEIQPMFTMTMQCNECPAIPGNDDATWGRIRVLDHESKFVKPQERERFPVSRDRDEQQRQKRFPADPHFKEELPNLAPVLLWKLFERYKIYKKTGLKEPMEVQLSTNIYKADNDVYLQFIQDMIETVKDEKEARSTTIKSSELFVTFNDWYKGMYPSYYNKKDGKINQRDMVKELAARLGKIENTKTDSHGLDVKKKVWYGYKFISDDDDGDFEKMVAGV